VKGRDGWSRKLKEVQLDLTGTTRGDLTKNEKRKRSVTFAKEIVIFLQVTSTHN
jgi:hypothetical protein